MALCLRGKIEVDPWSYQSVLSKLNCLEKIILTDFAYAVHQCTRLAEDPKDCHVQAMLCIGRYLHATKDKSLIYKPQAQLFDRIVLRHLINAHTFYIEKIVL